METQGIDGTRLISNKVQVCGKHWQETAGRKLRPKYTRIDKIIQKVKTRNIKMK